MRLRSQNVYSHDHCPSPQCQSVETSGGMNAFTSVRYKSEVHNGTIPQHGMRSSAVSQISISLIIFGYILVFHFHVTLAIFMIFL